MLTEAEAERLFRFLAYDEEKLAYLVPHLETLESRRSAIDAELKATIDHIARVRQSAHYYRAVLTAGNGNGIPARIPVPKDAFKGLPFVEAATKYLRIVGQPQATREIAEALTAGGYETESKHFTNAARTALDRAADKGELVSKEKKWRLPEWDRGDAETLSDEVSG